MTVSSPANPETISADQEQGEGVAVETPTFGTVIMELQGTNEQETAGREFSEGA